MPPTRDLHVLTPHPHVKRPCSIYLHNKRELLADFHLACFIACTYLFCHTCGGFFFFCRHEPRTNTWAIHLTKDAKYWPQWPIRKEVIDEGSIVATTQTASGADLAIVAFHLQQIKCDFRSWSNPSVSRRGVFKRGLLPLVPGCERRD